MSTTLTITEALAELRTIEKRLAKKRDFVKHNLHRPEQVADVFLDDGGMEAVVLREMQSIGDLEERAIRIRDAITASNQVTGLVVGEKSRTVHQWLVWKREIVSHQISLRQAISSELVRAEQGIRDKVYRVQRGSDGPVEELPVRMVYALPRKRIMEELDEIETTLGQLDGKLTLSNSRTEITFND